MSVISEFFAVKRLIAVLESMARSGTRPETLRATMDRLFHGKRLNAVPLDELQIRTLYRARSNDSDRLFHCSSELSHPPASSVKRKGRFNEIGQSVLYASNSELGTIIETGPSIGELFTIAEMPRVDGTSLLFVPVGIRDRNFSPQGRTRAERVFIEWLHDRVTKNVLDDAEYNITIAIGRHFLNREDEWFNRSRLAGLIYPSVQSKLLSNVTTFNFAVGPVAFADHFRFSSATVYCLTDEKNRFSLQPVNSGEFTSDGSIVWTFTHAEMLGRISEGVTSSGEVSPFLIEAANQRKMC